jgi:dienelactone hydrolase
VAVPLVFPEACGLSDQTKSCAEQLAGIGYITLALNFNPGMR